MKKIIFILLLSILSWNSSHALITVDITRGNLDPLPIAVSPLHVDLKSEEIDNIKKYANKNNSKIITTEKDYLRIDKQLRNDISYIEMDLEIIDENKFLQLIS